jgi:general secretion pathway protein N
MRRLRDFAVVAALAIGAVEGHGANPPSPSALDLPPSNVVPGPVDTGPPPAAPPPAAPPPSEPERPQLILVGAIASDTEGFAVFLDQATNNIIRLKTGQDHDGWVLRSVKGREATLQKNRQSTTLALPVPGGEAGIALPSGATPPGAAPPVALPGKRPEPEL